MHLWHEKLKNTIVKVEYAQLDSRQCSFKCKDATHELNIMAYVGNIVRLSSELRGVKQVKKPVSRFRLTSSRVVKIELGVFSS